MKLLNLILINLKRIMKNKVMVILTFLVPAAVTLIICLLQSSGTDSSRMYYIVNNDRGVYGSELVDGLSKSFNIKLYSKEEAMEKLKKKNIAQFYEIKEDFSDSLKSGISPELMVNRREPSQEFSDFEMKAKDLAGRLIISWQLENAAGQKIALSSLNTNMANIKVVNTKNTSVASQVLVNLLISFDLFSSIGLCFELLALKSERTLRRSLTTANRPGTVIGAIFGAQFILIASGYILIFLASAFLNAETLLPQAPIVILNLIMITAVTLSLAVFISRIVKNEKLIAVVLQIILCCICFIGGSFVPLEMLPKSITLLSRFTPQYWAIQSIKTCRYEYSLIVLLFAVLLFTAGTVSSRSFADAN